MSYNILAFDPEATDDAHFPVWFDDQAEWAEPHSYDNPDVCVPALGAFYRELIARFPPLNGPDSPDDDALDADEGLEDRLTDYSVGRHVVYAAFGFSVAQEARDLFRRLAARHGLAVAEFGDRVSITRP